MFMKPPRDPGLMTKHIRHLHSMYSLLLVTVCFDMCSGCAKSKFSLPLKTMCHRYHYDLFETWNCIVHWKMLAGTALESCLD